MSASALDEYKKQVHHEHGIHMVSQSWR